MLDCYQINTKKRLWKDAEVGLALGLMHTYTHRCRERKHLAWIQTTGWRWAEEAAGLSAQLDQFGVSHTSPRGYLPFSEVQRGDKMKESSHLTKGKRKKTMGTKPTKQG